MCASICQYLQRLCRIRTYCCMALMLCSLATSGLWAAPPLPANTTLPISFLTNLEAGKNKVNDPVRARTVQDVVLADGKRVPKGTVLIGHITQSAAFHFNEAPYAEQKPSVLGIHFDRIEFKQASLPVSFEVRALAGVFAVEEASRPFNATEWQMTGPMLQVGGDTYWPPDDKVRSKSGDIVAYLRKEGVVARPLAAEAHSAGPGVACDAVPQEQAVSIFSASACGLYGMADDVLESNGSDGSGTFILSSNRTSVFLLAHSAALLEVLP